MTIGYTKQVLVLMMKQEPNVSPKLLEKLQKMWREDLEFQREIARERQQELSKAIRERTYVEENGKYRAYKNTYTKPFEVQELTI